MRHKRWLLIVFACAVFSISLFVMFAIMQQKDPLPMNVTLAHDKGNLPIFQENFIKQGEMARKAIGIGINPIPSVSPDLFMHQMKASLPTEQAPELFIWWSTFQVKELVDKGYVGDLTSLWDKYKEDYSPDMRDAFTIGKKVYGFPYVVEYWPVWYNKKIFNRLELKEPETWTEFIDICIALKKSGVPPILSSLQNNWPAFIWFEEMMIGEDPDLYNDLCLGRVKYTDPRVVKACLVWKDMIEKGYFTDPSVNMLTNGGYLWSHEKFGMALCGTWYYSAVLVAQGVDEEDIGVFILPSHNPAAGKNIIFELGPIFTAKNAANAVAAQKVADWWMSREGNQHFAILHKAYPGNLNTDTDYLPPAKQNLLAAIKREQYRLMNRYWEATPISDHAVLKFGEFMLDPDRLLEILDDIDRISDQHWANNAH